MKTRDDYDIACRNLHQTLINIQFDQQKKEFFRAGKRINRLLNTYHPESMSQEDLTNITNWIEGINAVIANPADPDALATHIANTEQARNFGNDHKWFKVFAGVMLAIAGLALTACSIAAMTLIATGTLPVTGPIASIGLVFGCVALLFSAHSNSLTGGSMFSPIPAPTLQATAAAGWLVPAVIGIGCTVAGTLFAIKSYKGPVKNAGEEIENAVHQYCKKKSG